VSLADGAVEVLAAGGTWSSPRLLSDGAVVAIHESFTQPARLCVVGLDGAVRTLVDHTPASVRAAPHVVPEHVTYRSLDGMEVHGWLYRPVSATPDAPCPAVVQPHGGPTSLTGDEWDGVAQWFVAKGYAWFAINFRGSTTYGREFERANHGVWGVADTEDCLAAHDHLGSLGWVDATRVAIFGASYGSYLALTSTVDDPEHRYAAAVMKYGDCDILTSWAQGDVVGRLDLERMMGIHVTLVPATAGSPIHRIEQLAVPVPWSPMASSERWLAQPAGRAAGWAQFGTSPFTEGHGLLRPNRRTSTSGCSLPRLAPDAVTYGSTLIPCLNQRSINPCGTHCVRPQWAVARTRGTHMARRGRIAGRWGRCLMGPSQRERCGLGRHRRRLTGHAHRRRHQDLDTPNVTAGGVGVVVRALNLQYATLTDKAAADCDTPGPPSRGRCYGGLSPYRPAPVHLSDGSPDGRRHRLYDQHVADQAG
jgi:acetyl esterase/lipase